MDNNKYKSPGAKLKKTPGFCPGASIFIPAGIYLLFLTTFNFRHNVC